MSITSSIKRFLYRRLSLHNYLLVLSGGFFAGLRLGLGRRSAAYEYPRFLHRLVRPGDTAIDIGANLGYYSRILARKVGPSGKVYAVEPVKPILGVLEHNLRRCPNVEIMPYALGRENRSVVMVNDSSRYTGYMGTGQNRIPGESEDDRKSPQSRNTLSGRYPSVHTSTASNGTTPDDAIPEAGSAETQELTFEVEMRRGSELFGGLQRLDFIKCDIEGYEIVVIPEMAAVIRKHLPLVLIETGGANRRPMIELFRESGYAGYILDRGRLVSVMRTKENRRQAGSKWLLAKLCRGTKEENERSEVKDIIFIPGHRHAEFAKLIAQ